MQVIKNIENKANVEYAIQQKTLNFRIHEYETVKECK
jgi:hypothetical protein